MDQLVIGVDIGGTRTKYGLVNITTGEVADNIVLPTEKSNAALFLEQVGFVITTFREMAGKTHNTIAGIGIGVPGFTGEQGVVVTTYGFLDFMENFPIKSIVEKEFGLSCCIDNDARAVSLGEALYGKGKGFNRVITLTLGTGVGFGLVVNGAFTDALPLAHMGGHMTITDEGERCYCGKTGCLEALVSSTGIINAAKHLAGMETALTAEFVFNAASNGNAAAMAVVEKTIGYLHTAVYNYVNLFAPDIVVLGGGIAKGLEPFITRIRSTAYLPPFPSYTCKLEVSALQELAGMLGSAALLKPIAITQKQAYEIEK